MCKMCQICWEIIYINVPESARIQWNEQEWRGDEEIANKKIEKKSSHTNYIIFKLLWMGH